MKKLLAIIVLGLMFSGNVYAESKLIETKDHKALIISTFCIDGYKFVTTNGYVSSYGTQKYNDDPMSVSISVNTIQFMTNENGIMVPAKCD